MYEGRRLKRMTVGLPGHALRRERPQFVIDKWQELIRGLLVAVANCDKHTGHFTRRRLGHHIFAHRTRIAGP